MSTQSSEKSALDDDVDGVFSRATTLNRSAFLPRSANGQQPLANCRPVDL